MPAKWRRHAPSRAKTRLGKTDFGGAHDVKEKIFRGWRHRENQVGAQLHWLHRRHAPDHPRARISAHAAGRGARGHSLGARHDSQSAAPRRSEAVEVSRKGTKGPSWQSISRI